jgi:hypothetical protein
MEDAIKMTSKGNLAFCRCGIHGTTNQQDVNEFMIRHGSYQERMAPGLPVLVVVEPSPDENVIIGTHGWRAKKAFISEIITGPDKTMEWQDAVNLLSLVWDNSILVWMKEVQDGTHWERD